MTGNGPYETAREARQAAHQVITPERGSSILSSAQNRMLLGRALEAAGVECGRYDDRIVEWLAGWEDGICQVIAGWVARAAQRPEGTATEWGVTLEGYGNEPFAAAADEGDARQYAAGFPRSRTVVVRREVGPWTPVPVKDGNDD